MSGEHRHVWLVYGYCRPAEHPACEGHVIAVAETPEQASQLAEQAEARKEWAEVEAPGERTEVGQLWLRDLAEPKAS